MNSRAANAAVRKAKAAMLWERRRVLRRLAAVNAKIAAAANYLRANDKWH